jgi:hypothetical protein
MKLLIYAPNKAYRFIRNAKLYASTVYPGASAQVRNLRWYEPEDRELASIVIVPRDNLPLIADYKAAGSEVIVLAGEPQQKSQKRELEDMTKADMEALAESMSIEITPANGRYLVRDDYIRALEGRI